MKKLALALATTAILGFAAPAFAADSDMTGSKPQTQSPSGQTSTPSAQTPTPSQTPSAQSQTPSTQTQTPSAQNQTPSMQNKASAQSQVNGKAKSKDRKSTRLNSSHMSISYAVFCLKKKKKNRRSI